MFLAELYTLNFTSPCHTFFPVLLFQHAKEEINVTITANQLDLSPLSPASRREVRDFYQFLLSRRGKPSKTQATKYNFSDLCGSLSWKGDAVAVQRSMRDEW